MNVLRDDLVGCDALIFYPWENIKFIEGEINTSKMDFNRWDWNPNSLKAPQSNHHRNCRGYVGRGRTWGIRLIYTPRCWYIVLGISRNWVWREGHFPYRRANVLQFLIGQIRDEFQTFIVLFKNVIQSTYVCYVLSYFKMWYNQRIYVIY